MFEKLKELDLFGKFDYELRTLLGDYENIIDDIASRKSKYFEELLREEFGIFATREEILSFIESNVDDVLTEMTEKFNKKSLPIIFRTVIKYALLASYDFNIHQYIKYIETINYDLSDLIELTIEEFDINRFRNVVIINKNKLKDLSAYGKAVKMARKKLGIGKQTGLAATYSWTKYFQCAREGRKIYRKQRVKTRKGETKIILKDVSNEYAKKYWKTIETRIKFLPKDRLPFYEIIDVGNLNVRLSSDVGGRPYPIEKGINITEELLNRINEEVAYLKGHFASYFELMFPNVQFLYPEEYEDYGSLPREVFEQIVMDFYDRGIFTSESMILQRLKVPWYVSMLDLENELRDFVMYELGYEKARIEIIKTRGNKFSLIVRMPDGRFARWRQQ